MDQFILDFESWVTKERLFEISIQNYKTKNRITRFLDEALEINESNDLYFGQTDHYKDNLDDFITEKIISYVNLDGNIDEGFWADLAAKSKEIGQKAVDAAKKIIGKIGDFVNGIKFFLKRIFKILVHSGKELFTEQKEKVFGEKQKAAFKEKMAKENVDKNKLSTDVNLVKDHAVFTYKGTGFEKDFDDEAKNKTNDITTFVQKDEGGDQKDVDAATKNIGVKESFLDILDLFKDVEILELLMSEESDRLFEATDADLKPSAIDDTKLQSNKLFVVIDKVVGFLIGSILNFVENLVKNVEKEFFKKWTEWNNKRGGPATSDMPALSLAIAASLTVLLEVISTLMHSVFPDEKLEVITDIIYYGIHGASLLGIINVILKALTHNKIIYFTIFGIGLITSVIFLLQELGLMDQKMTDEVMTIKSEDDVLVKKIVGAL